MEPTAPQWWGSLTEDQRAVLRDHPGTAVPSQLATAIMTAGGSSTRAERLVLDTATYYLHPEDERWISEHGQDG